MDDPDYKKLYMKPSTDTFTKVNDQVVKITKGYGRSFNLCQEAAVQAIQNIRASRASFATQEAWSAYLNMYERAMAFMGWKIPPSDDPLV